MKELLECKTLGDYFTIIRGADKIIRMPKKIDCSKGLVFVLGNLDEAYGIHDDISPDVEADMFRSITEDIGITEVKTALQERFRNEQIGRFGNNIITYPSLSKKNFQDIIEKEVSRIFDKFNLYPDYKK
jgi:cell division protease FtsH